MQDKLRLGLGSICWSGLVSGIILARLYTAPVLTSVDWALIFLASVFAGVVLAALENIVLGFGITIIASSFIVAIVLSLPAFVGLAGQLGNLVTETALAAVVQAMFPFTVILIFLGGVLGGFLAEWRGLD